MPVKKVWEKVDLPRGDLQLLTKSHPSGVLRLTQSNYGIDQTTYFRDVVFGNLLWRSIDGKEMASASFNLLIEGVSFGVYHLELSYKPSWESNQDNYTTGLHWGSALDVIQKERLIGKTLTMYEATDENFEYQLDIHSD